MASDRFICPFGRDQIKAIIPHRDPFLFLDEVLELIPGEKAVSKSFFGQDGWYFTGHFPDHHVFPGVLLLEALAQTSAVCAVSTVDDSLMGSPVYFLGIEGAKFRRAVYPDSSVIFDAVMIKKSHGIWVFDCKCRIDSGLACEAIIKAKLA